MPGVEFEDDIIDGQRGQALYNARFLSGASSSGMTRLFVRLGIAGNEKRAEYLLAVLTFVLMCVAIFLIRHAFTTPEIIELRVHY